MALWGQMLSSTRPACRPPRGHGRLISQLRSSPSRDLTRPLDLLSGSPQFSSPLFHAQTPLGSPSRPGTPLGARSRNPTGHSTTHSTSLLQSLLRSPSVPRSQPPTRPSTPPLASSSANTSSTLSIATPQQFYDWFSLLTSSLEHEQDALYRDHLAEIATYREACDRLVQECQNAEDVCKEMGEAFGFVEERSKSLQEACEELLEEQVSIHGHART